MGKVKNGLAAAAPAVVAFSLIAGNVGLLCRRGLHPNLETAVGFLWIVSDYALRQKQQHPVAAPRINAAGVILGSLCLSASGLHSSRLAPRPHSTRLRSRSVDNRISKGVA